MDGDIGFVDPPGDPCQSYPHPRVLQKPVSDRNRTGRQS